jgi:hypothetical protein
MFVLFFLASFHYVVLFVVVVIYFLLSFIIFIPFCLILPLVSDGCSFLLVVSQVSVFHCVWNVKVDDFRKEISCKTQRLSLYRGLQIDF